ncbi:transcriptional repressor ILP1 [Silene latifolia]|uniref:transcriptional repressor ILP1 n=1 Tax=Silene latifolia TaxID=37657 RepID=UPI003D76C7F3
MSSRSKNFRRRGGDDSYEDNDANGSAVASKATPNVPAKSSSKVASSDKPKKTHQKLLSFVEDEDESPFSRPQKSSSSRPSKSSSSHRVTSVKERLVSSSPSVPSNVQPSAGLYTKEALLELQKNTRTLASSRTKPSTSDSKHTSKHEPVIVLKGSLKPVMGMATDDDASLESQKDDTERRLGLMGIEMDEDMPDQATINAIRAKRERLRQSRAAAPDYISLDAGSNHGAAEGLSDEEPEFQTRIALFGEKKDGPKKGVFEDVDERSVPPAAKLSVEEEDEDEEERKWEEEQFRKGLGKRMDDGSTGVSRNGQVQSAQPQSYGYVAVNSYSSAASLPAGPPSIGGAFGGMQGIGTVSISQQAQIAKQALKENFSRLKESHGKTLSSLSQVDENLVSTLTNITALEKSSSITGEKYIFMQKLRDFVSVTCDFLQHKAPYIEELEEQMQELHKKRASVTLKRRAADNDDEMAEVQAAVDAAMTVLGRGGGNATTIAAAVSAAQVAIAAFKQQKNLPIKLDDFGRDLNRQKRLDMERRAKARQERRNRSERKRMASVGSDVSYQRMEGESSTDESENENVAYKSNRKTLLETAKDVFSDASEEYSQLSSVKEIFERWKRLYAGSYRDAYISLSIPSIFSPYVRLELLKWDPLHEDTDFFDMRWHSLLFDYGVPADGSEFSSDDVDANLIPGLVEKVALPILHHDIAHCWDMLSGRESKNAVSATSVIINYVPISSEALKELIATIRARLAEAVANLVVPTWSAAVMKAVPNAARIVAYRFGMAIRLIRNICMWKDILVMPALEKLVLDELLCGKILPHVQNLTPDVHDAVARAERIVASLTGVWTGPSVTGARSPKLQPLVNYVRTLGKNLEKRQASGAPENEVSGLARRLKKMLVELNEYDEARSISRTFRLKEAL